MRIKEKFKFLFFLTIFLFLVFGVFIKAANAQCEIYITSLPYTVSQSNKYYCLNQNLNIAGSSAISFSSGVQNTTLDCKGYNLKGNNAQGANGVYLNSNSNNTIKNCNVTNFWRGIYLYASTNNIILNNTVSSNHFGISLGSSNNNQIINNIVIYNPNYSIYVYSSNNNQIINNIVRYATNIGIGIYVLAGSSNNTIKGGSVSNNNQDYFIYETSSTTNTFINTDFTGARTIIFYGNMPVWFIYNNETTGNIWLKTTNASTLTIRTTRELIKWSQSLMQWNDSAPGKTLRYEISGLKPNTEYNIYNNSVLIYTLQTDQSGNLPSFTVYLSSEQEIKVQEVTPSQYSIYGQLKDKSNKPLQATISADSNSNTTDSNGNYFLSLLQGIYDVAYNFQDFWIKILSFTLDSNKKDLINYVTRYSNKLSFTFDFSQTQKIQVYSDKRPLKVLMNNSNVYIELTEASSQSELTDNKWYYDSSAKRIDILSSPFLIPPPLPPSDY
jgi:parallel beta-helix repeat protein